MMTISLWSSTYFYSNNQNLSQRVKVHRSGVLFCDVQILKDNLKWNALINHIDASE